MSTDVERLLKIARIAIFTDLSIPAGGCETKFHFIPLLAKFLVIHPFPSSKKRYFKFVIIFFQACSAVTIDC